MTANLTISVAATDRALLTRIELRIAAGLKADDASQDTALAGLGLTVADIISNACDLRGDGLTQTTLLRETLVQTFRRRNAWSDWQNGRGRAGRDGSGAPRPLFLARRFLGAVSVVEDGVTLADTDFETRVGAGLLYRLSDGARTLWNGCLYEVTFEAGFPDVPRPLADIAAEMVARRTGAKRDPLMMRERVEVTGVEMIDRQYWADASQAVDITPDMASRLDQYRSIPIG